MPKKDENELTRKMTHGISKSQKEVTILFTDIEDSTAYWHKHGDVKGRLMVDRHNRILFPLVKRFRGRVVKTIGDAIMAMFKRPEDALLAAIAMQQALREERTKDPAFAIKVRIGIHTGDAIVEHDDVYGDLVNVASRVEQQAKGDEIAVSSYTRKALSDKRFTFVKGESFVPKGKKRKLGLFLCKWEECDAIVTGRSADTLLTISSKQKREVLLYLLALPLLAYFFYTRYLRYFIADNEYLSMLILNPGSAPKLYIYLTAVLLFTAALLLYRRVKTRGIPHSLFQTLKGTFAGGLLFMLLYVLVPMLPKSYLPYAGDPYYKTEHLIVEVLKEKTVFYERPSHTSKKLFTLDSGQLLLLTDVKKVDNVTWNKVLVGKKRYAWVQRVIPAKMGVPRTRVTRTDTFTLHHRDIYITILALLGFLWGYRRFSVKPF